MVSSVIKLHLLIEEVILEIISMYYSDNIQLKGDGLSCYKAICVWEAAKKLNKIRNRFAYHLEP